MQQQMQTTGKSCLIKATNENLGTPVSRKPLLPRSLMNALMEWNPHLFFKAIKIRNEVWRQPINCFCCLYRSLIISGESKFFWEDGGMWYSQNLLTAFQNLEGWQPTSRNSCISGTDIHQPPTLCCHLEKSFEGFLALDIAHREKISKITSKIKEEPRPKMYPVFGKLESYPASVYRT